MNVSMVKLSDLGLVPVQLELTDEELGEILQNHLNAYPLKSSTAERTKNISSVIVNPTLQKLVFEFCIGYCSYLALLPRERIDERNRSVVLTAYDVMDTVLKSDFTSQNIRDIISSQMTKSN